MHPAQGARQHRPGDDEGQYAEGQVDIEDPAPGQVGHAQPADEGPDHGRHAEHGPEETHVPAAFAGRDDIADDRLGADQQSPATEPLEGAKGNQLGHGVAESRQGRADDENDDGSLKEDLTAILVPQLSPQRGRDRRGQQIRRHDPREMGAAVEIPHNGRERSGDDRPVESGQQEPEEERTEDEPEPPLRDGLRRGERGHGHAGLSPSVTVLAPS